MKKISAVIITCNESKTIERTLKSVSWCDEILVVDSGSSDDTVAIAEANGARVITNSFESIGAQKKFAVSQAKNNWVLSVDGDEEISEQLRDSIVALPEECRMSGYYLTGIETFCGKVLKHSRRCHTVKMRLFDRRRGNFNEKTVHESVELEGRTGRLKGFMIYHRFEDLSDYFKKFNAGTSRIAKIRYDLGERTFPGLTLVRFPIVLFQALILKGAIRDGYEGVLMAIFQAVYSTVKYAKLLEIQDRKNA